jgi:hypothetical protein
VSHDLFLALRSKHPVCRYESFAYSYDGPALVCTFAFSLSGPDAGAEISFAPRISIPCGADYNKLGSIDNLVFHLGLIELISYWKSTCSPEIHIRCGSLTDEQKVWWHDLFLHGLGEFFYRNQITLEPKTLLTFHTSGAARATPTPSLSEMTQHRGPLILVGGGKDSAVTLELFADQREPCSVFALNPIAATKRGVAAAGFKDFIEARRVIDPQLIALNKQGYLNGHTPFSAYLAFLGTLVAFLHGRATVLVSNERSADEENVIYHGVAINHQYSKSLRFEKLFRAYAAQYLTSSVTYCSLMRPLHDLQVTQIFARYQRQHALFRSCNVGHYTDTWCGSCPKCAFVYLTLSPFLSVAQLTAIFGVDLFLDTSIQGFIRELVGKEGIKPFECVGSQRESRAALALSLQKRSLEGAPIPPGIEILSADEYAAAIADSVILLAEWGDASYIPEIYREMLRGETTKK